MVAGLYSAFNTMLAVVALWLERVLQPYRRATAASRPGFSRQAAALAAMR